MKQTQRTTGFESGISYMIVPTRGRASFMTLSVTRLKNETTEHLFRRIQALLKQHSAYPLMQWIFGGIQPESRQKDVTTARYVRDAESPVIWLNGDGNANAKVTSIQIFAIIRARIRIAKVETPNGTACASYSDDYGTYGYLGGSFGMTCEAQKSYTVQTQDAFDALKTFCRFVGEGTSLNDITRTWFYLDHLLSWYDEFNTARTDVFKHDGIFDSGVPSSTGIGAMNSDASAVSLSAFVVKPNDGQVTSRPVNSPLQCPAPNYRSAFSRAHLVTHPDYKMLLISGTASILLEGESAHIGDCAAQIDLTMKVVKAILDEQKMGWSDTVRAICYFKDIRDIHHYLAYVGKHHLPEFPTIFVQCDVCRDELLFEIELDLIQV